MRVARKRTGDVSKRGQLCGIAGAKMGEGEGDGEGEAGLALGCKTLIYAIGGLVFGCK